jgi:hypothetical protein
MSDYRLSALWKKAFELKNDELDGKRDFLKIHYEGFRSRVSQLVSHIHADMPSLTVHDITHIDALWSIASEIAGDDYPINPAEAFVLGGAFLLHDAAHCVLAYPGGLNEIENDPEWISCVNALGLEQGKPERGTEQYQSILFSFLRKMHPTHARRLASLAWTGMGDNDYLIESAELREAYSDVIGLIAESHWNYTHALDRFRNFRINPPALIFPAQWDVDVVKLCLLLRVADAAHIDAQRAPRFIMALSNINGYSRIHWQFQNKINSVKRYYEQVRNELYISGGPFSIDEQDAWWLCYETALLIDRELRQADKLLLDIGGQRFKARSVSFCGSPEEFSKSVQTTGWHPVDTSLKISDRRSVIERFGGDKLYGDKPFLALRELIQNALDAVHICRQIGGLDESEGSISVKLEKVAGGNWLHVTDTGIGMSRYVLTDVLLDFGKSLWKSNELSTEWNKLGNKKLNVIGQFGIGFFSVFMLGREVKVTTRRFERKESDELQYQLHFPNGLESKAILKPPVNGEELSRSGTRVSVFIDDEKLAKLMDPDRIPFKTKRLSLAELCANLAPAIDVDLYVEDNLESKSLVVKSNDWRDLSIDDLAKRIAPYIQRDRLSIVVNQLRHLDFITNSSGVVVGRCAISPMGSRFGFGVVNGIFAGYVEGVAGIVFCKNQNDLARGQAIPDVSYGDIFDWGGRQKKLINKLGLNNEYKSTVLVEIGCGPDALIMGRLQNDACTYEAFCDFIKECYCLIIHYDDVVHSYEDSVGEADFDSYFIPVSNLLVTYPIRVPEWLMAHIPEFHGDEVDKVHDILIKAMSDVWGEFSSDEEENVTVGSVNGIQIKRDCTIFYKTQTI